MRQGFRPLIEPPSHRRAIAGPRRPVLYLSLILVAVLFVIIIFGVSAWNVYEHRFGKNTFIFHSGDEVALSQVASDFSATFCDSYKVSLQGLGQVIILPERATVNTTFSDDILVEIQQLPFREFNVKYIYLLRKSSVNVTACRNSGPLSLGAEIVFIRGDSNFQKWRRDNYCDDCVLERTHIPEDAYCGDASRRLPRLYHQVEWNDKYFLLVYNGRPNPRHRLLYHGTFLSGVFSRTHFDLSDAEKICLIVNDSSCMFDLPWMSSKDAVVKFEGSSRNYNRSALSTHCHMRVIFWVCIFGILPFVFIILTLTLFGCLLCRKSSRCSRTRVQRKESDGERRGLLQDQSRYFTSHVPQNEENGRMAIQSGS